jgi:ParB family chromosome partitioning protein
MSKSIAGKIKINSFADIVGGDDTAITEVPVKDLHTFYDHPFRVIDDEKMEETVESIREYGVLMPGIVRPRKGGGYEIIAGHRRKRACEIIGLETMPVVIRNYTDDEAVVAMVDSNIQREDILPSEKARAYRLKFEAVKHQGKEGGRSYDKIGEAAGESAKTVQRYLALSNLSDELLERVDSKQIPVRAGIELSYLPEIEQAWVEEELSQTTAIMTPSKAAIIRNLYKSHELTLATIRLILASEKPAPRKVTIKADRLSQFFPEYMSEQEIEETIYKLLEEWRQKQ